MMGYQGHLNDILDMQRGAPKKHVLVVEGGADIDFLTCMLDKPPLKYQNIQSRWIIAEAGGKDNCIKMIERNPDWHAMVDRDTWSDMDLHEMELDLPHLHTLPRFCIENYLCDPHEVFEGLGKYKRRLGSPKALEKAFFQRFDEALAHGALWRAVQPLYNGLRALGFNDALLNFRIPDMQAIDDILTSWHNYLDPARIKKEYGMFLDYAKGLSPGQQTHLFIHGKCFFQHVIVPFLESNVEKRGLRAWQKHLLRNMPLPRDLEHMLMEIFTA